MFNSPFCPTQTRDVEVIRLGLKDQLVSPVKWHSGIIAAASQGALSWTEVSPLEARFETASLLIQ